MATTWTSRKMMKLTGAGLAAFAALVVLAVLALQVPFFQRAIVDVAANRALGAQGVHLQIEGTGGFWPWRICARGIELSDAEGIFLEFNDVALRLHPLALLGGAISVERLDIGGGTYSRQPQVTERAPEPFRLPDLSSVLGANRKISIQTLDLRSFAITLTDTPVVLHGGGGFQMGPAGLTSTLQFDAGGAGAANLMARVDAAARTIVIDANVSDPEGRWLAPLLPLAPGTPIVAGVTASGPQEDVTIAAAATWGAARFQLDGTAHWRETLGVSLEGHLQDAFGGNTRAMAGSRQDFESEFEMARDGAVQITTLHAYSTSFDALIVGTLADNIALDGRMAVEDATMVASALGLEELGETAATFQVTGSRDRPVIELEATVGRLAASGWFARGVSVQSTSRWTRNGRDAAVTAHVNAAAVDAAGLPTTLAGQGAVLDTALRADLARGRLEVSSLTGTWGALALDAAGDVSAEGPMRFEGAIGARDLALLDPRLSGGGHVLGTARRTRRDGPLEIVARGETDDFSATGDLATIIGPAPVLQVEASVSEAQIDVAVGRAEIAAGQIAARGGVDRAARTLAFEGTFVAADVSGFRPDMGGTLAGQFGVSGGFAAPQINIVAQSPALRLRNIELRNVEARLADNGTGGTINLQADESGGPLALDFPYARSGADFSGDLTFDAAGLRVAGPMGFRDRAPQGQLQASAADIGPLVALVRGFGGTVDDLRAQGSLAGELTLEGWQGQVSLAIASPSLEGMNTPAQASQISLDATFDLGAAPSIDGRLIAENVLFGPGRFSIIDAKAHGPLAELQASLSLRGPLDDPFHLDAEALRREAGAGSEITLGPVRGRSLDFEVELASGGTLTIGPQGAELAPTVFAVRNLATEREGRLNAEARLWTGAPYAQLLADNVPAGSLAVFGLPVDWTGILDGTITLDARGGAAPLRVAMTARELTNDPDLAPLDATLMVDASGRELEAQLSLTDSANGTPLLATRSTMPLAWRTGQFTPAIDWDAPLTGFVRANAPLERLWPFVPVDSLGISGLLNADVTIAGTLSAPTIHGQANLANGALEHFRSGFVLRDARGAMSFDEDGVLTADLQGTDGNGGTAHLSATAHLPQSSHWAVDGRLRLDQLTVARRDELGAQVSGELHLTGSLAEARLEGAVTMDRIDAHIPNQLPPSVVDLPVVRVNEDGSTVEIGKSNGATRTLDIPIDLDVTVNIPRRAFVRGRGLDSEWAGALALGGTMHAPRLDGTVSIVRGTFDLSRSRFELTEGTIEFLGGDRINPQVRIQGEAPGPDFTAIIRATGPARAPTITLTSDPVVPQETVMAQILFGKRPEELSAFELVQIGEATASLSGSGGFDLLGSARRATGLDVLSIGARESASGEQDVNLTVGRYVAPNVFVGARRGFEPGSGAVTVEMEVTPQVTVDAEVRQDAEGSVGVDWRWDY